MPYEGVPPEVIQRSSPIGRRVREAIDAFGKIDILVNNFGAHNEAFFAGTSPTLADQNISQWDDDYQFNLRSQVLVSLAAVPYFIEQGGGKIGNISSVVGKFALPSQMRYGSFKAGSIYFNRTLAVELGKHNINVNCVGPGGVYSGMMERGLQKAIDAN